MSSTRIWKWSSSSCTPGSHVHFAGEFARLDDSDRDFALAGRLHDLEAAFDQNEDARDRLTLLEKHFARRRAALSAERREPGDLRRIQLGEHRFTSFGWIWHRCSSRPPGGAARSSSRSRE